MSRMSTSRMVVSYHYRTNKRGKTRKKAISLVEGTTRKILAPL